MQIHSLGNFKNCYFLSIAKFSIYLVLYFESSIVKSVINNSENPKILQTCYSTTHLVHLKNSKCEKVQQLDF